MRFRVGVQPGPGSTMHAGVCVILPVVRDGFDVEDPSDDDFAGMLAVLDARLPRRTIAHAIGMQESDLELVAIGHAPSGDGAERLRALYELARRTDGDLGEPRTILEAAGMPTTDSRLLIPLALVPRKKTFFVLFLVFDAILLGFFVLVFALRS